jgi:hypothetical protein
VNGCWAVDVTVSTHDALKQGVTELPYARGGPTWHRIFFAADEVSTDVEAVVLAAQMCMPPGGMCTGARLVSWPEALTP